MRGAGWRRRWRRGNPGSGRRCSRRGRTAQICWPRWARSPPSTYKTPRRSAATSSPPSSSARSPSTATSSTPPSPPTRRWIASTGMCTRSTTPGRSECVNCDPFPHFVFLLCLPGNGTGLRKH